MNRSMTGLKSNAMYHKLVIIILSPGDAEQFSIIPASAKDDIKR